MRSIVISSGTIACSIASRRRGVIFAVVQGFFGASRASNLADSAKMPPRDLNQR